MNISVVSFGVVIMFLFIVLESVRRGILETKYSLLWILTCVVLAVLSISTSLLEMLANLLGIFYAPSLLFLFGLLFSLIIIFDLTRRISQLNHKIITLTQDFTLLKQELKEQEKIREGSKK
ncbi:DUF2304 domain-containing protein [Pseudalkalibacillus berkeleyi]|uniref:DUF2304 domain-containing protein n=1 Tax=Pseudalkalibacillus berkeleyi TaxID=1069813 RepID=A0ABS9H1C8_9BACL|nr:DUF2304 domain-containing protein [Pseudalkalibacillus berkeleyi]MCF6138792.1 DUF2304 domain-containing protein [Pseudalkalibacillus berkeleyi]